MNLEFNVNIHDDEGRVIDKCIMIYVNNTFTIRFEDSQELKNFIRDLEDIREQILTDYGV